ncbi:MAG: hypothetical protein LUD72_08940 [Bacteroidales bacterium]|nr:hypothetical protein [Bacteroidales bacterium]
MSAQIFNFSLRNTNQQLLDEAFSGAFVKITQSYELCDTVTNDHFGRDGKDYFNKISFVGIKTERGLIVPAEVEHPWTCDRDFDEYRGKYKPLLTESSIMGLNVEVGTAVTNRVPFVGDKIADGVSLVSDSTYFSTGMQVDSISGQKRGWFVWLLSDNFEGADSVRVTSLSEPMDVPSDGKPANVDLPDFTETLRGGIYVTPVQTAIGQVALQLVGYMVYKDDKWQLVFPFIRTFQEEKRLTPISNLNEFGRENLKSNRRR